LFSFTILFLTLIFLCKIRRGKNFLTLHLSWQIRQGDIDLKQSVDDGNTETFDIKRIYKHPKYNETAYFDIAVLQIAPVNFKAHLRPVCLPDSSSFKIDQYDGLASTLIGWGSKSANGKNSATLRRIILTIYEYR